MAPTYEPHKVISCYLQTSYDPYLESIVLLQERLGSNLQTYYGRNLQIFTINLSVCPW